MPLVPRTIGLRPRMKPGLPKPIYYLPRAGIVHGKDATEGMVLRSPVAVGINADKIPKHIFSDFVPENSRDTRDRSHCTPMLRSHARATAQTLGPSCGSHCV